MNILDSTRRIAELIDQNIGNLEIFVFFWPDSVDTLATFHLLKVKSHYSRLFIYIKII